MNRKSSDVNDTTDAFDHWLMLPGVSRQSTVVDASVEVRDTLKGMWLAAQSVFGEQARPEHAISLLSIALARKDAADQRRTDELGARREDES